MKGQVAGSAVAIASLAREGFEPNGDLIFVAAADEEVGVDFGCSWLCREHPDAVRAEYVLNEGAGDRVEIGGKPLYLCSTSEKMTSPFVLRVHGRAGHASMPGIADNALVKAAKLIERLGEFSPQPQLEPEVAAFMKLVTGEDAPAPAELLDRARAIDPVAVELVEPQLGMTLSPTMISASKTRNVIPSLVEVTVDCRLLPGQTQDEAEQVIREVLGEGDYELEWLEGHGGTRSPMDTPLWDAIESWVAETEPEAAAGADLPGGIHGQPLAEVGVRDGRLRLLPDALHGSAARDAARPLGGREGQGRRSRARNRVPALRRPGDRRNSTLSR